MRPHGQSTKMETKQWKAYYYSQVTSTKLIKQQRIRNKKQHFTSRKLLKLSESRNSPKNSEMKEPTLKSSWRHITYAQSPKP